MLKTKLKNQKGFTLIEIIAVLVILGILAAIAIPRYIDMQADARRNALQGAVASLISSASMDYAQGFLSVPVRSTASSWTATATVATGNVVGDFTGDITAGANAGEYIATVTASTDTAYDAATLAASAKTFRLY